jgi:hypothetical protein
MEKIAQISPQLAMMLSDRKAKTGVGFIFELIFICAVLGIGLPIGIGFILFANYTGWDPTMANLMKVGAPSLIILFAVFGVFEYMKINKKA